MHKLSICLTVYNKQGTINKRIHDYTYVQSMYSQYFFQAITIEPKNWLPHSLFTVVFTLYWIGDSLQDWDMIELMVLIGKKKNPLLFVLNFEPSFIIKSRLTVQAVSCFHSSASVCFKIQSFLDILENTYVSCSGCS